MNNETYILHTFEINGKINIAINMKGSDHINSLKIVEVLFEGTYRQCLGRFANIKKKQK